MDRLSHVGVDSDRHRERQSTVVADELAESPDPVGDGDGATEVCADASTAPRRQR